MQRRRRLFSTPVGVLVRSIRFRLALWFAAILAAVLVAFSVFVYARQAQDLRYETLERLNRKSSQLEAYLKYGARDYFEKKRSLSPGETQDDGVFLQENDILALLGPEDQVIQKVGPISEADIQELASAGFQDGDRSNPFSYSVVEAATEGQLIHADYLFVVAPISVNRTVVGSFVLGSPVDPTGQLGRLLITLLLGNLATLGVVLAGGYWLADRAMRPVQTITRAAREIGDSPDLSRRLNLGKQDELGELADTFDGMLARLQAAFERQRQFTADASHELRTPLTIVGLEAGRALAARRTPQEYQRALTVIQSENEWMTRLVNNLLTLSRMDAGQAAFDFEPLDLSDVTLEVVERLTPLAERRGVSLSTGELPELKVSADRQFLGQMISNLVENAIKYGRGAEARVLVETGADPARQKDGRAYAWVRVEDNGPGIAPEQLPRLFDRFYQVDQARSRDEQGWEAGEAGSGRSAGGPAGIASGPAESAGSGLGLSIVQQIALAHGGEVSVQSEPGQGSVFTVRLPLLEAGQEGG